MRILYIAIGYSPGDRPLAGYQDNMSGGECLQGFKMAIYVQPTDPPTTTQSITPTTAQVTTTDLPTTDFDEMTTKIGIVSTQPLLFTQDTNNTTSGTVALINLNRLLIMFVVCFIEMTFVC